MPPPKDSLESISQTLVNLCPRYLGVDGFRVAGNGFVAALDLVLDLSTKPITRAQAAAEATNFVVSRGADDVVFEVVVEHRANGS
jgi:hypothetical protein